MKHSDVKSFKCDQCDYATGTGSNIFLRYKLYPTFWSKLLSDPLIQHWKSTWIGIWRYIWENFSAIYAITIHIVNHPLMPTWGKSIPWKGRSNVTNAILPLLWKRIWQNISAKVMAKKSLNAINVIMLQVEDHIILDFFL